MVGGKPADTPIGFPGKGTATPVRAPPGARQGADECDATKAQCLPFARLTMLYGPGNKPEQQAEPSSVIFAGAKATAWQHCRLNYNTGLNRKSTGREDQHDHGEILTPIFMPVGTVGSVKAVTQPQLKQEIKAQIILGNTIIYTCAPITAVLEAAGGYTTWVGKTHTWIVAVTGFSLAQNRKIQEEGVVFQSHIDGSRHLFYPGERYGYSAEHRC